MTPRYPLPYDPTPPRLQPWGVCHRCDGECREAVFAAGVPEDLRGDKFIPHDDIDCIIHTIQAGMHRIELVVRQAFGEWGNL